MTLGATSRRVAIHSMLPSHEHVAEAREVDEAVVVRVEALKQPSQCCEIRFVLEAAGCDCTTEPIQIQFHGRSAPQKI